jgi:hypothetical protein
MALVRRDLTARCGASMRLLVSLHAHPGLSGVLGKGMSPSSVVSRAQGVNARRGSIRANTVVREEY